MGEFDTGVTADSPSAPSGSGVTPASPTGTSNTGVTAASPAATESSQGLNDNAPLRHEQTVAYERFAEANRRAKQAEESAQRWQQVQQQYGQLADPNTYRAAMEMFGRFKSDPVTAATELLSALSAHEQYRPQVASHAARVLNGLRNMQPREEPEPQPDLVAENGAPVYSAQQHRAWNEWNQRRTQSQIDERLQRELAPLKQLQQEREVTRIRHQAETEASRIYEKAKAWHGFAQHEAEIAKVFNEHPDWQLQDAYLHVLHTKILPSLPAQAQAQVVADLQQKAAAQSLSPTPTANNKAPDFKGDFLKALEWAARQR